MKYNMPHQREKEMDSSGSTTSTHAHKLYKPLPLKAGEKANNEVFVPLFSPAKWSMFNPTPEQVAMYGVKENYGTTAMADLGTFYFKLPVHNVANYRRPDGSVGFAYLLCPIKLNDYLVNTMHYEPYFENPRCAHCEAEQEWWNAHNARWAERGYDEEGKKNLGTKEYRSIIEGDDVLKNTRKVARSYKTGDRYVISIFDHDKFAGKRPLDEGQEAVAYQLWLAPKVIFEKLTNIHDINKDNVNQGLDVAFFDPTSKQGLHILTVTKDTFECSGNDLRFTKYDVTPGKRHAYQPEWLAYLNNLDAMVDPSDFVFLANYDDMKHELGSNTKKPVSTRQQQPPTSTLPKMTMPSEGVAPEASVPAPPQDATTQQVNPPVPPTAAPAPAAGPSVPPVPDMNNSAPTPPAQAEQAPVTPPAQAGPPTAGLPNEPAPPVTPDRTPPAGDPPPAHKVKW